MKLKKQNRKTYLKTTCKYKTDKINMKINLLNSKFIVQKMDRELAEQVEFLKEKYQKRNHQFKIDLI